MQFDGLIYFFLVIAIGYAVMRLRVLPDSAPDVLPPVLINICYPALVLQTFSGVDTKELLSTGLPVVIATLCITFFLYFSSYFFYRRQPRARIPLLRFITGIGNVTYVAIPLLSVFLSEEAMFIVVIHGAVQDFLIWSLYQQLFLRGDPSSKGHLWKKLLTNPCLIAAVAGVILVLSGASLPSFLQITAEKIAATTSPIALLFLGMLIQRYGLWTWRKDRGAMLFAACKVLAMPCAVFAVLQFFLPTTSALLLAFVFGSPSPLTSVVWAKQYQGDVPFAVNCCLASTLLFLAAGSIAMLAFTSFGLL